MPRDQGAGILDPGLSFQGGFGKISQQAQHGEQDAQDQTVDRRDNGEKPEMADPRNERSDDQAPDKPFDGFLRAQPRSQGPCAPGFADVVRGGVACPRHQQHEQHQQCPVLMVSQ